MRLTVDQARSVLLVPPETTPTEVVSLREAVGRTLAAPLIAPRDQPPTATSAMDGFAIGPGEALTRRLVGESRAGQSFAGVVQDGEAVRISTGAEVPAGCQQVVIRENAQSSDDQLRIKTLGTKSNLRPRGSDFATGDVVLDAGRRLRAGEIALAAAAGFGEVLVARRPLVTIICTGDELLSVGAPYQSGKIYNSNAVMLAALVDGAGGQVLRSPPIPDSTTAILHAAEAAEGEVLVLVGGASVGVHDHSREALVALGLRIDVPGLEMKPGKPFWSGLLPDGRRVVGLPGNPVTAFICAHLFLLPHLAVRQGRRADRFSALALANPPEPSDSERWRLGRLEPDGGLATARLLDDHDSASTTALAAAELIVRVPLGAAEPATWDAILL